MEISVDQRVVILKSRMDAKFNRSGLITGLGSGFLWGVNNMLLGMALLAMPVVAMDESLLVYAIPLAAAAINDTCAAIALLFFNVASGFGKEIWRSFKTLPGLMVCLAAVIGGPIAQSGYLVGVSFAGPAYALTITALYPIIGALLSRIFLKQQISVRMWVGILLSVLGAIVISYTPPEGNSSEHFYLGLLFAGVAALGWGAEIVLAVFGMSMIDPKIAINLREITSGAVFLLIILPAVGGWLILGNTIIIPQTMGLLAAAGVTAGFSYLMWYSANSKIGVAKGMAMNSTFVMWGVILSVMFAGQEITQNLVIGSVCVLIGVTLVAMNPLDFFRKEQEV